MIFKEHFYISAGHDGLSLPGTDVAFFVVKQQSVSAAASSDNASAAAEVLVGAAIGAAAEKHVELREQGQGALNLCTAKSGK